MAMTVLDNTQLANTQRANTQRANTQRGDTGFDIARDPVDRLAALFDPGTVQVFATREASGVVTARGEISGTPAVGFASDPGVQGGAMGAAGCAAIVAAYTEAVARG